MNVIAAYGLTVIVGTALILASVALNDRRNRDTTSPMLHIGGPWSGQLVPNPDYRP